MLTNLDFLAPGQPWPPRSEQPRLERYAANKKLWEGDHADVYIEQLRRIERSIGSLKEQIGYAVVPNYQRLISLKTADLLVGEPPEISAKDDAQTEALAQFLERFNLQRLLYQAALDISRYGDAVLTVRLKSHRGSLGISQPSSWFPVVSPSNTQDIQHHVIAQEETETVDGLERPVRLHAYVHSPGTYTYTVYALEDGSIGRVLQLPKTERTTLSGFAVFPLRGITTSDSIFGCDDYVPVDSIVSEIMIVISNISRILDKHSAPSMQGSINALVDDGRGEYVVPPGNFFIRETNDPEIGYITWDGQLSAAFEHLKNLLEQLYVVSEMGEAVLGTNNHTGVTTYKGLKLRMIGALAKVKRITANITEPVREAISAATQIDATMQNVLPEDISIWWNDGIPDDPTEEMELIQMENGGRPTMSHLRSVMLANKMTREQAEEELAMIQDDAAAAMPVIQQVDDDGEGDDDD